MPQCLLSHLEPVLKSCSQCLWLWCALLPAPFLHLLLAQPHISPQGQGANRVHVCLPAEERGREIKEGSDADSQAQTHSVRMVRFRW